MKPSQRKGKFNLEWLSKDLFKTREAEDCSDNRQQKKGRRRRRRRWKFLWKNLRRLPWCHSSLAFSKQQRQWVVLVGGGNCLLVLHTTGGQTFWVWSIGPEMGLWWCCLVGLSPCLLMNANDAFSLWVSFFPPESSSVGYKDGWGQYDDDQRASSYNERHRCSIRKRAQTPPPVQLHSILNITSHDLFSRCHCRRWHLFKREVLREMNNILIKVEISY